MTRKTDPSKVDDAIRLHAQGMSIMDISKAIGVGHVTIGKWMRDRGVNTSHAGRPNPKRRTALPEAEIVSRYLAGESEKALAQAYNTTRAAIRLRLTENGIQPRNRSASMRTRMANTDPIERARLTEAAHAAVRGRARTDEEMAKRAVWAERTLAKIGRGEKMLAGWLASRGLSPTLQKAYGRYNIDIAILPVAVELLVNAASPLSRPHDRRKVKHLTDQGIHIIYVWVGQRHFLSEAAADDIVAFFEQAKSDPSPIGKHRVIRGTGELVTEGRGQFNQLTLKPSPIRKLDSSRLD